jgi:hypothetical protein
MRQTLVSLVLAAAMLTVSGCANNSSSGSSTQLTLNSGNWLLYANSTVAANTSTYYPHNTPIRGSVTISGSSISANLVANNGVNLPCFQNPFDLSGEAGSESVTLAPTPPNTPNLAITASIEPGSILLGAYSCSTTSIGADSGTIYGVNVPSLSGNWSGTAPFVIESYSGGVVTTTDYPIPVAATIQQASSSSTISGLFAYALSGTVTLTSSYCFSSGSSTMTIDPNQSYVTGDMVSIVASASNGTMSYSGLSTQPPIIIPTTATQLSAMMTITGDSNNCSMSVTAPLTKTNPGT